MGDTSATEIDFERLLTRRVHPWLNLDWSVLKDARRANGKGRAQKMVCDILQRVAEIDPMPLAAWRESLPPLVWTAKGRSNSTWNLVKQKKGVTKGAEVALQRAVIQGRGTEWWAEVASCSGYNVKGPTRRAVDLVQKVGAGHFRFIELKVASNNPIYAAIELATYALLYASVRNQPRLQERLHPDSQILLSAKRIDFAVLAPRRFYAYKIDDSVKRLRIFSEKVNAGYQALGMSISPSLEMTFEYRLMEDFEGIADYDLRLAQGVNACLNHTPL